jgi:site-specific DNA-methyltransferase (adenine-specific)
MNDDIRAVLEGRATWCVVTAESLSTIAEIPELGVDHVITDPPYDAHTHENASTWTSATGCAVHIDIDFPPISPDTIVANLLRVSRRWTLSFCSFEMLGDYIKAAGKSWIRCGIYRRTNGAPQFTGDRPAQAAEAVAVLHNLKTKKRWNGGGKWAFWESPVEKAARHHPTQKPLPLMMQLIEQFTDKGELVLDPFCGAGTTGVAAVRQGRRFIGVELQEKYAVMARKRIAQAEEDYRDEEEQRRIFEVAMAETYDFQRGIFDAAMAGDC